MRRSSEIRGLPLFSVVLGALMIVGCSGGGDGHSVVVDLDLPTAPTGNAKIEGVWDVSITYDSGARATGVITLDQSHPYDWEVIGTLNIGGSRSDLVGAVAGYHLSLTATLRGSCARTFELTATINPSARRIDGSISGKDCSGRIEATFSATRR